MRHIPVGDKAFETADADGFALDAADAGGLALGLWGRRGRKRPEGCLSM